MFNLISEEPLFFYYEFVSFEELYKAYKDCKKRKRSTNNCEAYEINEFNNLYNLYIELNTLTYKIGRSTVFIYHNVGIKNYREIFAADFKDRIVQHLIVNRIINICERIWNDRSFSCRKGKGTLYGIIQLYKDIKYFTNNYEYSKDYYVCTFDIYSFFASLDKYKMYEDIKNKICENIIYNNYIRNQKDLIYTLYLIKLILYNDPRKECIFKQPKYFWNHIPNHKSAFHSISDHHYLAVGNITSQIFANLYISNIDKELENNGYISGRYVDDIYVLIKNINEFYEVKKIISHNLSLKSLKLQENKTYMQHINNGVKFCGNIVKINRIYVLNKTKGKFIKKLRYFYDYWEEYKYINKKELRYMLNSINSSLGLFMHSSSYNIRKNICKSDLMKMFGKYCYINHNYSILKYIFK